MEADRNDNRTDLSAVHGVLLEMLKTLAKSHGLPMSKTLGEAVEALYNN